jgi:hypothetical protein
MMKSVKMIEEGAALLYDDIVRLVRSGRKMDLTDHVYGYVYDYYDDSIVEADVLELRIVDDTLFAFMDCAGDEKVFTVEERDAMLGMQARRGLPGWYALDAGFYGLQVQTLLSIADSLETGQEED